MPFNFFGTQPKREQIPIHTPQQQNVINSLLERLQGQIGQQQPSVSELFQPIKQQAKQGLQEQGIPGLLGQFAAGGGLGSHQQYSALAKAQSDLEGQLAAQEAQATLGRQGQEQQQLLQLLGVALQPQFDTIERGGTQGVLGGALEGSGSLLQTLLPFLFGAGGLFAGGPAGGAAGYSLGQGVSSLLPSTKDFIQRNRERSFRSKFGGQ